jgi:hypothetical protein
LHCGEALSFKEIGRVLCVSEAVASGWFGRAVSDLRAALIASGRPPAPYLLSHEILAAFREQPPVPPGLRERILRRIDHAITPETRKTGGANAGRRQRERLIKQ